MANRGSIRNILPPTAASLQQDIADLRQELRELRTATQAGDVITRLVANAQVFDPTDTTPFKTLLSLTYPTPAGYTSAAVLLVASMTSVQRDATTTGDNTIILGAAIAGVPDFPGDISNTLEMSFPTPLMQCAFTTPFALTFGPDEGLSLPDSLDFKVIGTGSTGFDAHGQIYLNGMVWYTR